MAEDMAEKDVRAPNLIERAKEEIEAIIYAEKAHHEETHGLSNVINEDTPVDQVKAPNVFERAKEELEAIVETIHSKKEDDLKESKTKPGFWSFLGGWLEKACSPGSKKQD